MTVNEILTAVIAFVSLLVSGVTAWLTLFRRGRVVMTRPAIIGFAFDGPMPKVFLRFLLHCTAHRGKVIETMHIVLVQGENRLLYTVWGYGDANLVRGSGLFVGHEGVAANHHFVQSRASSSTPITPGNCDIHIYASTLGSKKKVLLRKVRLSISEQEADAINKRAGVIYDWDPELKEYRTERR